MLQEFCPCSQSLKPLEAEDGQQPQYVLIASPPTHLKDLVLMLFFKVSNLTQAPQLEQLS